MDAQEQLQKLQSEINETNVEISQKESDLLVLRSNLVDLGEKECECLDLLSSASADSTNLDELRQIQDNLGHVKTRLKNKEQELQLLNKRLTQIRNLESKWKKILTAATADAGESVGDKGNGEPTTVVSWRYGPLSTVASNLKQTGVITEVGEAIIPTDNMKASVPVTAVSTLPPPPPTTTKTLPTPTPPASSYADLLADSIDLCSRSKKKELRKEAKKTEEARREQNKKLSQFSKSSLSYDEAIAESLQLCSDMDIDDKNNKKSGGDSGGVIDSLISQQQRQPRSKPKYVSPLDNARSRQWHPDYMIDPQGDANLSIREAFNNNYDEHYVFRPWRPSQGR